nr:hypothetical protein [Tanacetum cinerariifolium]
MKSGHDRPKYQVLHMLWGIITSTNVDYAGILWEEFVQAIQTFLTDKANLGSPIKKGRKDKPHVIPYCRFMKIISCHLGRIHNILQRSASLFHLTEEDFILGNLKFIHKGKIDEKWSQSMIRKLQPKSKERRRLEYKQPKSKPAIEKSSKPAHALKSKVTKERLSKASTTKPPKLKSAKGKLTKITPPQKAGKGKITNVHKDDTSFNIFRDTPSPTDAETVVASEKTNNGGDTELMQIDEEQGKDVDEQVDLKENVDEIDQGHARSDLDRTPESRPPPELVVMDEDQARPDPRESQDLISLTRTLSLMKNLEDSYVVRDQFINGKSTEDEIKRPNVEAKMVFMVTVLVYQASSLVPSLSTSNIRSRVFNLEHRDLPHKIDKVIDESVREALHVALQAPLRDRFRELPEANMKEILHQCMFETGTYKSLPKHVPLYEALEVSMERANRDELLTRNGKVSKEMM